MTTRTTLKAARQYKILEYKPGDNLSVEGYVTRLTHVRMRTAAELEQTLGLASGRLTLGYYIAFLLAKEEKMMDWKGFTDSPDGVDPVTKVSVGDKARARNLNVERGTDWIIGLLPKAGLQRLVKVIPKLGFEKGQDGSADYPPATSPVQQYKLTKKIPAVIVCHVPFTGKYLGYGNEHPVISTFDFKIQKSKFGEFDEVVQAIQKANR